MSPIRAILAAACIALLPAAAHASLLSGFDELERSLRLDPAQKAQYDAAVAATQRALLAVGLGALEMKERVASELAKPKPDLHALARSQDEIVERSRPLFREARDEWARLYAMLDPKQVAATRAFVEEKLHGLEGLGESLHGLLGSQAGR
ncbi:MAG TPA: hypothetical protein VEG27_10925 [Usitatibacter sp.]|nr:hypothetical protein [Usitatibacter sp.]